MQHTFQIHDKGTHVRIVDDVRGNLRNHEDTVNIRPISALVDPEDFRNYIAPTTVNRVLPIKSVERMAFRKALLSEFGITFSTVRSVIEGIADTTAKEAALIEFEEARSVYRNNALLEQIRVALGKTKEETDALFLVASNL